MPSCMQFYWIEGLLGFLARLSDTPADLQTCRLLAGQFAGANIKKQATALRQPLHKTMAARVADGLEVEVQRTLPHSG